MQAASLSTLEELLTRQETSALAKHLLNGRNLVLVAMRTVKRWEMELPTSPLSQMVHAQVIRAKLCAFVFKWLFDKTNMYPAVCVAPNVSNIHEQVGGGGDGGTSAGWEYLTQTR
jgi:hypothetical protein